MKLEFKKNAWYYWKDCPKSSNSALMYIKTTEKEPDSSVWYKEIIYSDGKFTKIDRYCSWDNELELANMKEVSKYLPEGHPDKVSGKILNKFNIGDVIVSLKQMKGYREVGDIFTVLSHSVDRNLYYIPDTCSSEADSFRLATPEEIKAFNKGIKNIKDMVTIGDIIVVTEQSRSGNYAKLNLVVKLSEIKSDGYTVETGSGPSFCENVRKATEEEIRLRFTTSAYKPGDWVTIEDRKNLQSGCTGCPNGTFKVTDISNSPSGLLTSDKDTFIVETNKGYWRISNIGVRPATKEEIEKVTGKTTEERRFVVNKNDSGGGYKKDYVFEVLKEDRYYIHTVLDCKGSTNGYGPYNFREATEAEAALYIAAGKPVSINVELTREQELLAEAKRRYPVGTKVNLIPLNTGGDFKNEVRFSKHNYFALSDTLYVDGNLLLYYNGAWATPIEEDPKLEVGDTVEVLKDFYGYKSGDIGVIRQKECGDFDVFVNGRNSTSAKTPYVCFHGIDLKKLPDYTIVPDYSGLISIDNSHAVCSVDFSRPSAVLVVTGPKLIIDDEEEILFTGISKIKIVEVKLLIN